MYLDALPNVVARASDADYKSRSSASGFFWTYTANVAIIETLIIKEINREIALSI